MKNKLDNSINLTIEEVFNDTYPGYVYTDRTDRIIGITDPLSPQELFANHLFPFNNKALKARYELMKKEVGDAQIYVARQIDANDRIAILHPSTKRAGFYQITFADKRGFSGDEQHSSRDEAVKNLLNDGYINTVPIDEAEAMMPAIIDANAESEKRRKEYQAELQNAGSNIKLF